MEFSDLIHKQPLFAGGGAGFKSNLILSRLTLGLQTVLAGNSTLVCPRPPPLHDGNLLASLSLSLYPCVALGHWIALSAE